MISETTFNSDNVSFMPPTKKDGKIIARMLYNGASPTIKTPWLRVPWVSPPYNEEDRLTRPWQITVQEITRTNFETEEENEEQAELVRQWFQHWRDIYEKFIDYCVENSKMFFGKQYSAGQREVVKALMGSVVDDHEEYPSAMKFKIPNRDGVPGTPLFRMGSEDALDADDFEKLTAEIPKGSFVRAVITPSIWIINKKAYMSFYTKQILLTESTGRMDFSRCAFDTGSSRSSSHVEGGEADEDEPEAEPEVGELESETEESEEEDEDETESEFA